MSNFIQLLTPFTQLLPPHLTFVTIVLVVFPCVVSFYLRLALHNHLVFLEKRVRRLIIRGERGNQPEIIKELETRFKEASSNLDQVNTGALINQVYSQEKVGLFSCEQIEYFCRTLPSLLLAFGLLGTFIGITINLWTLSETVSKTNISNIDNLLKAIQQPLQGMGIAFTTSLIGIFFSAFLTVVNLIKNTSVAKYKLISAIEDYLDNIYLTEVQSDNRLDKAVKELVSEFENFLGRFGTTVRESIESSLGKQIQQIVDENKKSSELAHRVYNGFQESAGTIARSATDLQNAISVFENSVAAMITNTEKYQQVAQIFENSKFPQKLSDATADLAHTQSNFSESAISFANASHSIEKVIDELHNSSKNMVSAGEEFSTFNQTSIQVLELHQKNQQCLREIIPQLYQGAQSLIPVIKSIDKLQDKITNKADIFSNVHPELTNLAKLLKHHTEQVNQGLESLGDRLLDKPAPLSELQVELTKLLEILKQDKSPVDKPPSLNELQVTLTNLVETLRDKTLDKPPSLGELQIALTDLVETLKQNRDEINQGIESLGDRLVKNNSYQSRLLEDKLQKCIGLTKMNMPLLVKLFYSLKHKEAKKVNQDKLVKNNS